MLRITTSGESHGKAMLAIVEGLPSDLSIDEGFINAELKRRQGGYGRGGRMSIEQDRVEILTGVKGGKTISSPVTLMIANKDYRIDKLPPVTAVRPGHGDLAGALKHNTKDARDILERASARDTVARTAAGALCRLLLREFGIECFGYVRSLGGVEAAAFTQNLRTTRDASLFYALDNTHDDAMRAAVDKAKADGDTLGGIVEALVFNCPPGLGSHTQWGRKLDGKLAQAVMSVQAIKSVEIGIGREAASMRGSQVHDAAKMIGGTDNLVCAPDQNISQAGLPVPPRSAGGTPAPQSANPNNPTRYARLSNNAGGLEAGITNGQPIVIRAAMKPISTLMQPLGTVDIASNQNAEASRERSDVCAVPAASVVIENVIAVPIAEAFIEKFGGDSLVEMRRNFKGYLDQLRRFSA